MELTYYRSKIKKLSDNYNNIKRKYTKLGLIFLGLTIVSLFTLLTFAVLHQISLSFYPIITVIFLITSITFFTVGYGKTKNFINTDLHYLIIEILNNETNYQLKEIKDKRIVKDIIRSTRFISKYDMIAVDTAFEFSINNVKGYFFRAKISRSSGKSSYYVLNGDLIVFEIENNFNCQFRTDAFRMDHGKKDKTYLPYKLYIPEDNPKAIGIDDVNKIHNNLDSLYRGFNFGIDYHQKTISYFTLHKSDISRPSTLNEESIQQIIKIYENIMEKIIHVMNVIN